MTDPIDGDMIKRSVRAFDISMDGHRGLGTGDFTAMRAALEASGLPEQNSRLVEELSEAKKEITDTEDRLRDRLQRAEKLLNSSRRHIFGPVSGAFPKLSELDPDELRDAIDAFLRGEDHD